MAGTADVPDLRAITMAAARGGVGYHLMGVVLLVVTTVLVALVAALVAALTVRAAARRQICDPE